MLYLRYWYKSGDKKVALAALDKEQKDAAVQVRALLALLAVLIYKSGDKEHKDAVQVTSCTRLTCFTGTKVVLRLLACLVQKYAS